MIRGSADADATITTKPQASLLILSVLLQIRAAHLEAYNVASGTISRCSPVSRPRLLHLMMMAEGRRIASCAWTDVALRRLLQICPTSRHLVWRKSLFQSLIDSTMRRRLADLLHPSRWFLVGFGKAALLRVTTSCIPSRQRRQM